MANNPFRGFTDALSETARQKQNWLQGGPSPGEVQHRRYSENAWTPQMDVFAEGEDLVLLLDLPGVKREEVELALSDGLLTISGQRAGRYPNVHDQRSPGDGTEENGSGGEYYTRERYFGTFRRSMTMPSGVSEGKIDARLEEGVLTVVIEGYAGLSEPTHIELQ